MRNTSFRPTFVAPTALSPSQALNAIRASVTDRVGDLDGQFVGSHAIVSFTERQRHFWSPWLYLEVRENEQGGHVFGRFSPHPSIWTAFMFTYLGLAVITFFAAIGGMAQNLAGETPWGFWGIPVCCFAALVLWLSSQTGQKLAADEMAEMKQLVIEALEKSDA